MIYTDLSTKKEKAGTESSKESSLKDWFGRKGAKGSKKVGLIAMHLTERAVISRAVGLTEKSARNIPHVDQLRVLVKSVEKENHGAKKENLRKMRIYTWI